MTVRLLREENIIVVFLVILLFFALATTSTSAQQLQIIEKPSVGNITKNSAVIYWKTNELSNSVIKYGDTSTLHLIVSDDILTTEHSLTISDLRPATRYYYKVQSTDKTGENTVIDPTGNKPYAFLTDEESPLSRALLISVIGMAGVFVVLIIIMYVMMFIQKRFGDETLPEYEEGTHEAAFSQDRGTISPVSTDPQHIVEADLTRRITGTDIQEDSAEIAALSVALITHLKKKGKEFGKRSVTIGPTTYEAQVRDPLASPVEITVNNEKLSGNLDGNLFPFTPYKNPMHILREGKAQRGRFWRSAYPPPIGSVWDRRGWNKRR